MKRIEAQMSDEVKRSHADFVIVNDDETPLIPQVYQSGDIIDTFIYRLGIEDAQYSMSAAVGLLKSVISLILISIGYKLAEKYGDYKVF